MLKITDEMRTKLKKPLPAEAVSQHPTKTYLSSIKSIYVVERINDVFGLGTWTLKSEVQEVTDKFIVVKAMLSIPEYGFYGEAFGGNDNQDRGDAYKGAVTDGLTKIAAQQLEIGIDVYKGLKDDGVKPSDKPVKKEHWCAEHKIAFFKTSNMKSYAHPIGATGKWCHEHTGEPVPEAPKTKSKPVEQEAQPKDDAVNTDWPHLTTTGELMTRAKNYGVPRSEVFSILEINDSSEISDLDLAWLDVAKDKNFKPPVE